MNKFAKLAIVVAAAVIAAPAMAKSYYDVQTAPDLITAEEEAVTTDATDNWVNGTGDSVWKNGTGEYCWRTSFWTPATAAPDCDGAILAETPPPVPMPTPSPVPVSRKVTYQVETLFDFDSAVLKPEGQQKLDELAEKIKNIEVEVIVATGHTDRIGPKVNPDEYNDRLSLQRAEAVKSYFASKDIEAGRIYTEGKGRRHPVKTGCHQKDRARLLACLAPNRRVEVEVVGTETALIDDSEATQGDSAIGIPAAIDDGSEGLNIEEEIGTQAE